MSETTGDLDKRLEDALQYYRTHKVSIREAAAHNGLNNHVTLLNRLQNKTSSKSNNGGQNKLLTPA